MSLDILRKTGGWCVELQQPLVGHGKTHTAVEIRPCTADHVIRWGQWQIPSQLALLAELCDIPEKVLRQLPNYDFERVMLAFANLIPVLIRKDFDEGTRPLASPEEDLPVVERGVPPPDQVDPRFPAHDGPIVRMQPKPMPEPPSPDDGSGGMNVEAPPTMQAVR